MKPDYGNTPKKEFDHSERKVSIRTAALLSLVLVLVGAMAAGAAAAPLEISMNEYVSTSIVGDTATTGVTGEITVLNNGTDDIYDIWVPVTLANYNSTFGLKVTFENASSEVFVYSAKPASAPAMDDTGANFWIQIPQLRAGQYAVLAYLVDAGSIPIYGSTLATTSPILVDTYTDASRIVSGRDVSWTVYFNATTNSDFFTDGDTVAMEINHYLSRNSTHFGSEAWTTLGPISSNRTSQGTSVLLDGLYDTTAPGRMQVTGFALTQGSEIWVNTSYDVAAFHQEMTGSIDEPFGFSTIAFSAEKSGTGEEDGVISGSVVHDCQATGEALVSVTKEHLEGSWKGNATFTNEAAGLVYVLTDYAVWATEQGTFGTYIEDAGWTPGYESSDIVLYKPADGLATILNPGESAGTETIEFAFDGVPVIWANATFVLGQNGTHGWVRNYTVETQWNATYGSDFIVSQSIWVVGDYLIKATKHVVPFAGEDTKFRVYIVVENIGGTQTPNAYIYDMIPTNMSVVDDSGKWDDGISNFVNSSALFTTNSTVATPMAGYDAGQIWGLAPLQPGAIGDGDYDDWTQITDNQQVVIAYNMTGSGDFRLSDVYIVGVDPVNSLNDHTSPIVTLFGGSKSANYEGIFILLFGAVMVAGVVIRRKK
ncbi:hypothetical protein AZH53_10910 [Methanomicrobiaceae archaeon CYW5]|uniref:hypothetical protein n=1 Tax=Methanovulcanius yangii TaxID=1789227 RepID=UPI0029C9DBA9|nr:hypothetical protein [Methanovulcanius yangii]MBT8508914.1 hypothetical protein [Methanovulcanius yangii]